MPRNLRRRIETLVPIDAPALREELDFILQTQLNDRRKGREVCGFNRYSKPAARPEFESTRSQMVLYDYYQARCRKKNTGKRSDGVFTVFRDPRSDNA